MRFSFEVDARTIPLTATCGMVGLFALHAAFPSLYDFWPKSSSDLATWVQAVGSIAAILGAFAIAHRQALEVARREQIREREMRKKRLVNFRVFLIYASNVFRNISSETKEHSGNFYWAAFKLIEVGGLNSRFSQINMQEFAESAEMMRALSIADASAKVLTAELDGYVRGFQFGHHIPDSLHSIAADVTRNLESCVDEVGKIIDLDS